MCVHIKEYFHFLHSPSNFWICYPSVEVYGLTAQAVLHSYNLHESRRLRRRENFPLMKRLRTSLLDIRESTPGEDISNQASLIPPLTEWRVYYYLIFFLLSSYDLSMTFLLRESEFPRLNRTWIFTIAKRYISFYL